jgi:BTB/POZ domain
MEIMQDELDVNAFVIVCGEGVCVDVPEDRAKRIIQKSRYFRRMFEHNTRESERRIINKPDWTFQTAVNVLQFIYSSSNAVPMDEAFDLMAALDQVAICNFKMYYLSFATNGAMPKFQITPEDVEILGEILYDRRKWPIRLYSSHIGATETWHALLRHNILLIDYPPAHISFMHNTSIQCERVFTRIGEGLALSGSLYDSRKEKHSGVLYTNEGVGCEDMCAGLFAAVEEMMGECKGRSYRTRRLASICMYIEKSALSECCNDFFEEINCIQGCYLRSPSLCSQRINDSGLEDHYELVLSVRKEASLMHLLTTLNTFNERLVKFGVAKTMKNGNQKDPKFTLFNPSADAMVKLIEANTDHSSDKIAIDFEHADYCFWVSKSIEDITLLLQSMTEGCELPEIVEQVNDQIAEAKRERL